MHAETTHARARLQYQQGQCVPVIGRWGRGGGGCRSHAYPCSAAASVRSVCTGDRQVGEGGGAEATHTRARLQHQQGQCVPVIVRWGRGGGCRSHAYPCSAAASVRSVCTGDRQVGEGEGGCRSHAHPCSAAASARPVCTCGRGGGEAGRAENTHARARLRYQQGEYIGGGERERDSLGDGRGCGRDSLGEGRGSGIDWKRGEGAG